MKVGTMEIGPIKYNENETAIFVRALLLGLATGLPIGVFLNYLLGFPTIPTPAQAPKNFLGWTGSLFVIIFGFEAVCLIMTVGFFFIVGKRQGLEFSANLIGKLLLAVLVVFPFLLFCIVLIDSAVIVPLDYFFSWLDPVILFWIGALIFLPFVVLFIAIIGPGTPAGKRLRRSTRKLQRQIHW